MLVTDGHRLRRITLSYFDPSTIQGVDSFNRVVTIAGSLDTGSADGIGQDARFNELKVRVVLFSFCLVYLVLHYCVSKLDIRSSPSSYGQLAADRRLTKSWRMSWRVLMLDIIRLYFPCVSFACMLDGIIFSVVASYYC